MLLIFPPSAKPSEPPAGIARLAAAVRGHGFACHLLDANLEGMLWLLNQPYTADDTWTRRALRTRGASIQTLKNITSYNSPGRYDAAVRDLNRIISTSGRLSGVNLGLADYQHPEFSPVRTADLIHASGHFEENPYYPYFSRRLTEIIEQGNITLVGFSITYLSQALCAFAMIGFIRKHFAGLKIVIGGGLVTSWMRQLGWLNRFGELVDHLVDGPGESAILALLGVKMGAGNFTPDYSGLPLDDYLSPGRVLPYSAAHGCYWSRCSFCPERAEGNRYIPITPLQVTDDLRSLCAEYNPLLIHILDSAVSVPQMKALIKSPPGVPWYGFARFTEELAAPDFCMALKESGCIMLKMGLESGDQDVLDSLNKGINLKTASQTLKNLHAAGIGTYIYLLFGTPVETEAAARRTMDFTLRHHQYIRFLNLALFNMPLCCDEAEIYGAGVFYEGDLSLYTSFNHPDGWGRKQVRQFLEKEFRREPKIASIVRNDPPVFTSNHAPFFQMRKTS